MQRIVEEVDCTPEQLAIRELNSGIYCFDAAWLWENLPRIPLSAKGEYYLTDMVGLATEQGRRVVTMQAPAEEVNGINTRVHLADAVQYCRRRILERHMLNGVTVVDPSATYIDDGVQIGQDTVILPGTDVAGRHNHRRSCVDRTAQPDRRQPNRRRLSCHLFGGRTRHHGGRQRDRSVRPPAQAARIWARASHMGNFGEVKNSYLGPGAKMGHFSYLGDAHCRAGRQHRRRYDHLQLRWRAQASDQDRRRRVCGQRHVACGAG